MDIQYMVDKQGQKVAVVIPIEDWEAIQARDIEYADDVTPEEIAEAEAAWAEYQADPGTAKPIEQVMREQLVERDD